MKFLCVECDEAMSLMDTSGPDRGSMTVVFSCPACSRRTAMLTNASETQVVRSLGVKIGGGGGAAAPMEGIRTGLSGHAAGGSGHAAGHAGGHHEIPNAMPAEGGSKCPFTGMVNEAYESADVTWTDAAQARIDKIPSFARTMAKRGVEEYAREEGVTEITEAVLNRARGRLGM